MKRASIGCFVVAATLVFAGAATTYARNISGVSSLKLAKPLTQDVSAQSRGAAIARFKVDLWEWMKEEADVSVDTTNTIQRFHFFNFADSCLTHAKVDQTLSGHTVTTTIALPGEEASSTLEAYNNRCYSISLRFYTLMKKALEENAATDLYNLGINTIYYTMGRMGTPIGLPDESTPRSFLLEESRKIMQNFFNKFAVRSPEFIITGKPGTTLARQLTIQVVVDTAPLAGIALAGVLPGGKKLCAGTTDASGSISFSSFRIPFVAKGTALFLKPDFSVTVPGSAPFDAGDLGITVPEQTLLFNIIPATFSVSYRANSASAVVIPKDFSSDGYITKYLHDSCFLAPAPYGAGADLYFTIVNQVSSYAQDEQEQTVLKLESDIVIEDANRQQLAKKQGVVFEKGYENAVQIPMGLFFWEAASKSMKMLKEMVVGL